MQVCVHVRVVLVRACSVSALTLWATVWVVITLLGFVWGYVREHRTWNHGTCRKCRAPWKVVGVNGQGAIGYQCGCTIQWFSLISVS